MADAKKKKGMVLIIGIGKPKKGAKGDDDGCLGKAWGVLKKGAMSELHMIYREEGEEAALQWLAERGVTGEEAMEMLAPLREDPEDE